MSIRPSESERERAFIERLLAALARQPLSCAGSAP